MTRYWSFAAPAVSQQRGGLDSPEEAALRVEDEEIRQAYLPSLPSLGTWQQHVQQLRGLIMGRGRP